MTSSASPRVRARDGFALFAALWAIGILAHMASYSEPLRPLQAVIVAAAFAAIWRPAVVPFLALTLLHGFYVFKGLPTVPNHSILAACADATIAAAALTLLLRRRSGPFDGAALYRLVAPVLRIELCAMYFLVVLHKLNTGFVNPDESCAAVMYRRMAEAYPVLPASPWVATGTIHLTLAAEALIPLLLFLPRTRLMGLVAAIVFHFMLAVEPANVIFNFSAILLGFFVLFTPDGFPQALDAVLAPVRRRWDLAGSRTGTWLVTRGLAFVAVPALVVILIFREAIDVGLGPGTGRLLWTIYAAVILVCLVAAARRGPLTWAPAGQLARVSQPALLIFPVLFLANGMMPYLGGKTETSFAMFSNLRTEGGRTNHFFMPPALQILGYQRDLVRVHRSSEPTIQNAVDAGWQWTYFEFAEMMRRYPEASVVYERGGVERSVSRVADDQELMQGGSRVLRKLLYFRPVPIDPAFAPCVH